MSELDRMSAMDALEWIGFTSADGIAQSITYGAGLGFGFGV